MGKAESQYAKSVPSGSARLPGFLAALRARARNGWVSASRSELARELGRSEETIRRWEHELEAAGLARCVQRRQNQSRALALPAIPALRLESVDRTSRSTLSRAAFVERSNGSRAPAPTRSDSGPPLSIPSPVTVKGPEARGAAPLAVLPHELVASDSELAAYKHLRARFLRSLGLALNTWPRAIEYMDAIARAAGLEHAMRYLSRVVTHNAQRFQGDRLARVSFGAIKSYAQRIAAAVLAAGAPRPLVAAPTINQAGAAAGWGNQGDRFKNQHGRPRQPGVLADVASASSTSSERAKQEHAARVERLGTNVRTSIHPARTRSPRALRWLLDLTPDLFPILPDC
jgi:hypothetical protein